MNYRKKLGIPAYQGHKGALPVVKAETAAALDDRPFRGRRSALDPYRHQLGTVPDAEIARLAGVTAENVRTYRQRRLIAPAWQAGDAPPGEVLAAVAAPAPKGAAPAKGLGVAPAAEPERARKPRAVDTVATPAALPVDAAGDDLVPVVPARAFAGAADTNLATAFLVLVDTEQGPRSYALLAADIAAAAAAAAARVPGRHPDGTIRAIQRIADLLPS